MTGALTITSEQTEFTQQQVAALTQLGVDNASPADLAIFFNQAQRTGLDPFSRQIYMIGRRSQGQVKQTIQVGIDGLRLIAHRTAKANGETLGMEDTLWADSNGRWHDLWLGNTPPSAAKVTVLRNGQRFSAVAVFSEYAASFNGKLSSMWASKPALMIAKCFDEETEVLTEHGFQKFADVDCRIMQVTETGLEPTDAKPFVQNYSGSMVGYHSDMLNFCVTPNHDMVTTVGKVEAQVLLAQARERALWHVPAVAPVSADNEYSISDEDLKIAGAVIADGTKYNNTGYRVEVSRKYKIDFLNDLDADKISVRKTAGDIARTDKRDLITHSDKMLYIFSDDRLHGLVSGNSKEINTDILTKLSGRQARILFDTWVMLDGHKQKKTGVTRLYTSNYQHLKAAELLAVKAGYTVNAPRTRLSDISSKPNYYLTISTQSTFPVVRGTENRPGIVEESRNATGRVWCVTVPSHVIVVRRHGFSMICGNCAEALALRKAFPADMSGLYTAEEMSQADVQESMPVQAPQPQQSAPSKPRLAAKRLQVEISTIFKECGVDSKELAGAALSLLANRTVSTTAELTADEAKSILADNNTRQRVTELVEATKAQAEANMEPSMAQPDIIDAHVVEE